MIEVRSAAPEGARHPGARATRPTLYRLGLATTVLALGTAGLLGPAYASTPQTAAMATADDHKTVTWGVEPSPTNAEPQRPNFAYNVKPGDEIKDSVRVRNYTADKLALKIYASDAKNTETGALDLLPGAEKPKEVGNWIALEGPGQFTLNSNQFVDIKFTLRVPKDGLESGDHVGGIVTTFLTDTTGAKGEPVRLERRLGTRVQLRVDGPVTPSMSVTNLKTSYENPTNPIGRGTLHATYTVTNTGNVRMAADQSIKVKSPIGFPARTVVPAAVPELLPGNSVELTTDLAGVWPTFRSSMKLTVTPKATRDGDDFSAVAPVKASSGLWTPPWAFLLLLLLLGGGFEGRRHMQQRQKADADKRLDAVIDAKLGTPAGHVNREATS